MPSTSGQRLKRAIHIARARAGITSDMKLSIASGVHYDTLMNWYGDKTVPRPAEVKKVAEALGEPFANLMAAYDGREPEPLPLTDAVTGLVTEVRSLVGEMRRDRIEDEKRRAQQDEMNVTILRALGALAGGRPHLGTQPGSERGTPDGTPKKASR